MKRSSVQFFLALFFFLASSSAFAEDQWFCKEGASRMLGEVMESCGIAKSADESEARKKALDGAFEEFDRICRESANCRDYEKTVEPMRTECIKGKDEQFTCYRALDFTITHQKKEKAFDDKDKKDAVVAAISANNDANPALANTSPTPSPNQFGDQPVVYRSTHYYTVANPFVYVIGSQPQVVYVRSQLPPQYLPTPQPPANPPSNPNHFTTHQRNSRPAKKSHSHHGHHKKNNSR